MAGTYKNSIMLGIKLAKASDVQKEMDTLIKELNKNSKVNLDVTLKDKNILGTLEKLSKELKEINGANFSSVDKSLKNVSSTIEQTSEKAKHLKSTLNGDEFQSASMSAAKGFENLSNKVDDANKKIEQSNKNLKNSSAEIGAGIKKTGESISSVGDSLTTKVSAPLALVAGVATKIGNDFSSQMSRVKAISGATGTEFKQLHDQALQLGADTAFSAKQAAEGMENLASAGFNTNEIMTAMPGLLDLAASSGESLANSSDIAASTLRGFGLEASQTAHVADVLAKNAGATNAAVSDTGEAMKYIAPVAHSMGLSLEEVTAAIGIMANAGIKGSQSGTTLRSTLTRLASPSKEAAGMMKSLGFQAFDSQGKLLPLSGILDNLSKSLKGKTDQQKEDAIATIFGQEAMSGMLSLIDAGSSQLNDFTNQYKTCDGAAKEMAKTMQDNAKSAIEQMTGSLETAAIKLQEVAAPSIINIANEVQDMANKFADLPQPVQESVIKFALLAATIGPVTKVVGTVTSGIGSLVTFGGRLASTLGLLGEGAKIGGTALTAFGTAGMVATGVASALVVGVAGAITYQELLGKKVNTCAEDLTTWEQVVNTCTGSVVKSKAELQKAGIVYKDFGEGVSDSFKEGIEKATKTYHDFEMTLTGENSGEKISEEGKKKISSAIDGMIDGAKSTINKRKSEIQSELSKMFNQKGGIDSGEQAVLDEAGKASDEKLKQVEEIQGKISDVWTKAIQEHGKLSQQDVEQIENYLQQVKQIQAEVEAKNTAESDFAKNQFGERLKGISAEDASKEYTEASQTLTKNFADARATYTTGMQELANMQKQAEDAGETARAESFKKQIEDKKKEYDELITTEKTKRREYLDMLYAKNPQLQGKLNEIDGSMFDTKDTNAQSDLNKLKQKFGEIASVTESGMKRVQDANGKWHDIQITVDSATGNITSAYDTMTGEFGAYSKKFASDAKSSGDRVKDSLENLQKSLTTLGGGVKLDNANNAINASTDEIIGKLQTVIEKADGTKVAIQDINGTQIKLEFDKDGALTNLNDVQDAINGKTKDNPAVVSVDVNDQEAMAKFKDTENNIDAINGQTPTVTPQAETGEADSKLKETTDKVDDLNGKEANATVTVDAGNSLSIIDRIKNFFAWITGKHETATVQVDKTGSVTEGDGYATGTDSATQGFHDTAEEGFEILVGKKKRWFNGGEQVLNHNDSVEVLNDLMNGKGSKSDDTPEVIPVETETQQTIQIKPKQTDVYQGHQYDNGTLSVNRANTLDKPYEAEPDTDKMNESEKKAYEEKKKAEEEAGRALKDRVEKEKQYLEDVGSAWEVNSKSVSQSIKNIELKETELGENVTVTQKIDLLNQKYQAQLSLLPQAEEQLNTYKSTTLTTADGQEELGKKIQEATSTLIEQKEAVAEAYNALQKYETEALEKLRNDLVNGLRQEREEAQEKAMERLDNEHDKKKERLQKQYDNEKQRLQNEKEKEENDYEERIKALQKQLTSLDESKENKQGKLSALQKEYSDWGRDNSSFGKKNKETLSKEIHDLQIDIQKDSVQKQIDSLNEQKDNSSKYYEDEIKTTDEYYSKKISNEDKHYNNEKKQKEKHYKNLLKDKRLYEDADVLITSDANEEMLKILNDSSESYKEAGYLTGKSYADAFIEEIEAAQEALKDMTGYDAKSSGSKSKSKKSKEVKVGDSVRVSNSGGETIDRLENGTAMSSSGDLGRYSGKNLKTTGYNNGYFKLTDEDGNDLGWARRDDIASYDTGGRTPSNIPSSGANAILHADEKVLNKEETEEWSNAVKTINDLKDPIMNLNDYFQHLKDSGALMEQMKYITQNPYTYSMPNISSAMDLSKIGSNLINKSESTTIAPNVNVTFGDIVNHNGAEANMNMGMIRKEIDKAFRSSVSNKLR